MRRSIAIGAALGLAACGQGGPPEVEYRVLSPSAEIASAQLFLCDQTYEMARDGGVWAVHAPVTCEGGGVLLVQLADGASVNCSGDHVEPEMYPTTYGYVVSATGCAFAQ